jgi:hypothetical protein
MAFRFRLLWRPLNRGNCRFAGNCLSSSTRELLLVEFMPTHGWPSLAAEVSPMRALIVGERPIAALQSERDVPPLCAVSAPASLQEGGGDERGPR